MPENVTTARSQSLSPVTIKGRPDFTVYVFIMLSSQNNAIISEKFRPLPSVHYA